MNVQMPGQLAEAFKNPAQQARAVTEAWGEKNLYCPNCPSPRLLRARAGTEAVDYTCPACESPFQLKSQSRPYASRIVDAAYDAMRRAITQGRTPNLLAMHYDRALWEVRNLVLVPRFVFTMSCIEKRNPLSAHARRHDWVGCNILLGGIPQDARILVVAEGVPVGIAAVRAQYARLRPLEKIKHDARGWTLDVLNVVRGLGKEEFTLAEVYAFAPRLGRLHPQNRNVEPKIRQQLQRLRDLGFVEFLGEGSYRTL
jgi:type II restriction enzyme